MRNSEETLRYAIAVMEPRLRALVAALRLSDAGKLMFLLSLIIIIHSLGISLMCLTLPPTRDL